VFNSGAQYKIINYYFEPESTAFTIFRLDTSSVRNAAIAYENEVYKTIGSFFEFGSLESNSSIEDREALMTKILYFFGLADYITGMENQGLKIAGISNFPNPFSAETTISFHLNENTNIEITIYDIFGKTIAKLIPDRHFESGKNSVTWDSKDDHERVVPPGIYFYQVRAGEIILTGKMIKKD